MAKHITIATIVALITAGALVAVLFLITLPQVEALSSEVIATYTKISNKEYQFVEDKYYVKELLSKKYTEDYNAITNFIKNNQYKPGNYDPFTPDEAVQDATNNSTNSSSQTNTNNNNSTSSGSSSATTNNGQVINGTNK